MRSEPEISVGETAEDRLRLIVESVVDYAIFMLDVEGRVVSWNFGAERLKGYRAEQIIGRHFSVFYPVERQRDGTPQRELDEAIAVGRVEDEGWRIRRDGTRFWANVVITPLRGKDGVLRGFAKVTRDLTERKRAEDALLDIVEREREAAQRLREADKAKQDLVAIVAHDLRAPVGILHGVSDMLLHDWERLPDDSRRAMLGQIVSSSDRLRILVEDVLDVARIEAGQLRFDLEAVDLVAVVERVVHDVDPERRRLIVTHPDCEVIVRADEQRVWQVLMNLVGNALKFSPEPEPVEIVVDTDVNGGRVSVTDHGPGIAPDAQARLFQRFSRVPSSPAVMGTGLGLYIARSLVTAQGGRIWMEDAPGKGATFAFTLPGLATAARAPAAQPSPQRRERRS